MMKLDLIRDLLDKQLVDRTQTKIGRVDGLVIEVPDDGPPVVDHFQVGSVVRARRVGKRVERLVKSIQQWMFKHGQPPVIIRWPVVGEITQHHIRLAMTAEESGVIATENWLRDHIVKKIPGSHK